MTEIPIWGCDIYTSPLQIQRAPSDVCSNASGYPNARECSSCPANAYKGATEPMENRGGEDPLITARWSRFNLRNGIPTGDSTYSEPGRSRRITRTQGNIYHYRDGD